MIQAFTKAAKWAGNKIKAAVDFFTAGYEPEQKMMRQYAPITVRADEGRPHEPMSGAQRAAEQGFLPG